MRLLLALAALAFPFVPQDTDTNCGAAVSAMVVTHYAEDVSIEEFYQGLSGIEQIRWNLEQYGIETEITRDPGEAVVWGLMHPYHWVAIHDGMVYDPLGGVYPLGELAGQGLRLK
jgi:hypothetical protein